MKNKRSEIGRQSRARRRAIELLRSPDFFRELREALCRGGLVGERQNASVLYVVALSSLLDRPLSAIVKGHSSAGKNFLVSRVLRLFPETAVREITSSSKTAWNYGAHEFCHRIVYLQERNEAAGAVHPVRLLISEGRLIRTVTRSKGQELSTKTYTAEGPIASISTTTKDRIQNDDETRHVSLWVDESERQTRRVIEEYVVRPLPLTEAELETWREAYRLIEERAKTPIIFPDWFHVVGKKVYGGSVTVRRYYPAFVEACRTVCLLRSFQRRRGPFSELREIEISFEDFAIASILFEDIFVESLHHSAEKTFNIREAMEKIMEEDGKTDVDASDLAAHLSVSEDRAYKMLREAVADGLVKRANKQERGNAKRFVAAASPRFLPDPEEVLAHAIEVPTPVEFIHPLTGKKILLQRKKVQKQAAEISLNEKALGWYYKDDDGDAEEA